jgi:hypothetical protein
MSSQSGGDKRGSFRVGAIRLEAGLSPLMVS